MARFNLDNKYKAIVIGGSAGSFQGITQILSSIPADFSLPIILCLHRLKHVRNGFVEALSIKSIKPVVEPYDKENIKRGKVYLAPANYHLSIELGNSIALSTEEMFNNSRPSIDITLETAAYNYRDKLIGILLSGANKDGALGMKRIKDRKGLTIIQDPEECMIDTMPTAAKNITEIDYTLKVQEIIQFLKELDKLYK
ncbi:putative chemotaxis protein-glutamate methylesterase [Marivirga tractuosa]|jgi:two-component system chemotaxis response regulator CheB|uniref:protein-glutamate methylesterase n=1 Tax=Marivirga tractuosa (strain ATCC 23168 / DSM 4126 / NBRC 15989 / NCIMB 1408 / VKM B-1430 / H-43) TaxID=643867 RepID=E4TQK8_MARTH|nr:chemotaxis protein CheB [Marivirga tractuosa]ADR23701.1 CheB methylesterase [Marivirga tractuosa DSM 4126]BDD15618.1 putative chemotaxis protein-glutamate methylesterase [Marivirga tractuosa]